MGEPVRKKQKVITKAKLFVWIRADDDIKLNIASDSDVADVLNVAAAHGEFQFLLNQTKHYNITYDDKVLARDDFVKNYTTRANKPLVIIKVKEEAKYDQCLQAYQVRSSGEHSKEIIKSLIEGITDYDNFILSIKKSCVATA